MDVPYIRMDPLKQPKTVEFVLNRHIPLLSTPVYEKGKQALIILFYLLPQPPPFHPLLTESTSVCVLFAPTPSTLSAVRRLLLRSVWG